MKRQLILEAAEFQKDEDFSKFTPNLLIVFDHGYVFFYKDYKTVHFFIISSYNVSYDYAII